MYKTYNMKLKYILFSAFSCLLLLGNVSCSDEKTYIPDPIEQNNNGQSDNDDDDGVVSETTTDARFKLDFDMTKKENVYQEIDGFGCAFAEWSHRVLNHTQREKVIAELFGKAGLELNFMRGEPFPHYKYDAATDTPDFGMDREYNVRPDDPTMLEDYWGGEMPELSVQLGQMWITDQLARRYPNVNIIYSTWSPPSALKTTGLATRGKLLPEKYQAFADYLVKFVQENQRKFGTVPYAISPTNEPNTSSASWSACGWTGAEIAKFIVDNLRPSLDKAGYKEMKIIVGEHSWWGSGATLVKQALDANPELVNCNVVAAGHGYFTSDTAIKTYDAAEAAGVKVWNTETSNTSTYDGSWADAMKWATTFHTYMTKGNLSAFIWWAGARPCTNNESLIVLEESLPSTTYWKPLRYYTYGHFTKHIRPGSWRVAVEKLSDNGTGSQAILDAMYASGYVDVDEGTFTIVAINPDKNKDLETIIDIDGYEIENMQFYVSSEDAQWVKSKINPSEQTRTRYVKIPKFSTVTITGKIKAIS